jgi:hypothetical protein
MNRVSIELTEKRYFDMLISVKEKIDKNNEKSENVV